MTSHSNEHAYELFSQLIARSSRDVVDDVLLGPERGQVIEQDRLRILDHQIVRMSLVEKDDALVGVEPAAPVSRVGIRHDGRQTT